MNKKRVITTSLSVVMIASSITAVVIDQDFGIFLIPHVPISLLVFTLSVRNLLSKNVAALILIVTILSSLFPGLLLAGVAVLVFAWGFSVTTMVIQFCLSVVTIIVAIALFVTSLVFGRSEVTRVKDGKAS